MKWIGLTGGIASGKSTAAKFFAESGIPVINADQLARDVTAVGSDGLKQVVSAFGSGILNEDKSLNRQKLGATVFSDPAKLVTLEKILHPLIGQKTREIRQKFSQAGVAFAIYDVPLLFEKKMEDQFDEIIVVFCNENLQRQRLSSRDGLSAGEIDLRLGAQIPLIEKIKRTRTIISNEGSLADLKKRVVELVGKLRGKYG